MAMSQEESLNIKWDDMGAMGYGARESLALELLRMGRANDAPRHADWVGLAKLCAQDMAQWVEEAFEQAQGSSWKFIVGHKSHVIMGLLAGDRPELSQPQGVALIEHVDKIKLSLLMARNFISTRGKGFTETLASARGLAWLPKQCARALVEDEDFLSGSDPEFDASCALSLAAKLPGEGVADVLRLLDEKRQGVFLKSQTDSVMRGGGSSFGVMAIALMHQNEGAVMELAHWLPVEEGLAQAISTRMSIGHLSASDSLGIQEIQALAEKAMLELGQKESKPNKEKPRL
jgi:hypothetical protein